MEAVKALMDIGGPKTVDPLVQAAHDSDPEIQIRATDGLVNVYLPGYVKTGISGTLQRAGNSIKAKFSDTNDQIIDAYVEVRPEVIAALGKLARSGASVEARANAARALGVLRGRAAIPDLVEALHSKDDQVMYEALIAIQKIRDPSAAPRIAFLLRDLDDKIQIAALETTGILRNRDAAPRRARRDGARPQHQSPPRGVERAGHAGRSGGSRHVPALPERQGRCPARCRGRRPGALKNPADRAAARSSVRGRAQDEPAAVGCFRAGVAGQSGHRANSARCGIWSTR